MSEQRRESDPRIDKLVSDVSALQADMRANTEITTQVRDVLASFRVIGAVAKWTTAIGAAAAAVFHGYDFLKKL